MVFDEIKYVVTEFSEMAPNSSRVISATRELSDKEGI